MSSELILLVDDEPSIIQLSRMYFEREGFRVQEISDGESALDAVAKQQPALVVLDVMLPGLDGFDVCRKLRASGNQTPIIMLTARDEDIDKILGLELGADDYLTKPFDLGELVARLRALLRRASHSDEPSDAMSLGPLTIDTARRLVFVAGERAELTKREFDLLAVLAENSGVVLSRQRLLELVWGYDFDVDTNVADVFVSYLRRKLEREGVPRVIHTVRGIGYVLRADP